MPTTYVLKAAASDLTGGADFTRELSEGTEATGTISVQVANSSTEDSLGYTIAGNPGASGSTGAATVEVDVQTGSTVIFGSIALRRVNSAGVTQATGAFTAEQTMSAGTKTFSPANTALGTWASGDRLAVIYRFRSSQTMGGAASITIRTGTTNAEVIAPWSLPTNLVVQDATHSHTADNVALTQVHNLTVADASHAHTADSPTLSVTHQLEVQDALHAHTADNVTITEQASGTDLVVQDASHAHTAENVALTQNHNLTVQDSTHSHTAESPTLEVPATLEVQDSLHAHSVDNVELSTAPQLEVQDALHAHTAENVELVQVHVLVVQDSSHAHVADEVTLTFPTFQFSPPTFQGIPWESGVDRRLRGGSWVTVDADPTWRAFSKGDRGRTVLRINGEYQTVTTPTQTLLNQADTITFPDGCPGPAVFLGGHVTEVTQEIRDELVAAGYEVEAT